MEQQVPTITAVLVGKSGCGKRTIFEAYARATVDPNSPALEENRVRGSDQLCDQQGNAEISPSCIARTRTIGRGQVQVLLHWINMGKEGEPIDFTDIPAIANARAIIYAFDLLNDPTFAGAGDLARAVSNLRRIRGTNSTPPLTFIVGTKSDTVKNAELSMVSAAPFLANSPRFAVSAHTDPQHAAATIDQIIVTVKSQMDSNHGLTKKRSSRTPQVKARQLAEPAGSATYGTVEEVERIDAVTAAKTLSNKSVVMDSDEEISTVPKGGGPTKYKPLVVNGGEDQIDWEESRPCAVCSLV